jgi:ferredoxin/truncated hemoglobin YjbI
MWLLATGKSRYTFLQQNQLLETLVSIVIMGKDQVRVMDGETILDACLRQGVSLPFSCRGGICQLCVMRCTEGHIPARAQLGLPSELVRKDYFLPCVCKPDENMSIAPHIADDFFVSSILRDRSEDASGVTYLFEPERIFPTLVTAFVVRDKEGRRGAYRLSNDPPTDYYFGLHIPSDDSSQIAQVWMESLREGDQIEMRPASREEIENHRASVDRPKDPPPDPDLWSALGGGAMLISILEMFYARVYADPQLAPFFTGFTQQRLREKQYSFLQQIITGNKVFFGNRPKNSHHWMVISDTLFELREKLMAECLRAHDLEQKWIDRLMTIEGYYRADIVKAAPFPRELGGIELPLNGFGDLTLDEGSLCDGCSQEVSSGVTVRYNLRLGTIFCPQCTERVGEQHA